MFHLLYNSELQQEVQSKKKLHRANAGWQVNNLSLDTKTKETSKSPTHSPPIDHSWHLTEYLSIYCMYYFAGGSEGASLGDLFRACEQGGVCPLGRGSEGRAQSEFRQSFLRRAADPQLNERLHRLRILTSTLKVSPHALCSPSTDSTCHSSFSRL